MSQNAIAGPRSRGRRRLNPPAPRSRTLIEVSTQAVTTQPSTSAPSRRSKGTRFYNGRDVPVAPAGQRYLDLNEVVAEFGSSTWGWRHRVRRGELPCVKLAGPKSKILIPREAIEAFFARGYRPAVGSEVAAT